MEVNLRNILILLSAIAIVAIFIHGLWTIRKNKNPYKLKTSKQHIDIDNADAQNRNFDGSGFDRDGVSEVKISVQPETQNDLSATASYKKQHTEIDTDVASNASEQATVSPEVASVIENNTNADHLDTTQALNKDDFSLSSVDLSQTNDLSLTQTITLDKTGMREEIAKVKERNSASTMYQEPVARAKPTKARVISKSVTRNMSKEELKRNQMEINFDGAGNTPPQKDTVSSKPSNDSNKAAISQNAPDQLVIALSVVMPGGQQMMGATLLPMLLTLGLKYGDLNIFHRHQDNAGNGDVSFSLVNMMNPGTFDLDTMETFATPGVSLFMALPSASDPFADFAQMLSAAKHIAQAFNAQVLDDKRSVMTKQTEQHYVGKIREFDRQHRLASVE